jgi:hypothetical protein
MSRRIHQSRPNPPSNQMLFVVNRKVMEGKRSAEDARTASSRLWRKPASLSAIINQPVSFWISAGSAPRMIGRMLLAGADPQNGLIEPNFGSETC